MEWVNINERQPPKGQIVEIWAWLPAIYQGENEYGGKEWREFYELEEVIYWRVPDDPKIFSLVLKHMRQGNK